MSDFTPRAKQILALARKEAKRFNHNYVGVVVSTCSVTLRNSAPASVIFSRM